MADTTRSSSTRGGDDGVRTVATEGGGERIWMLVAAVALVVATLAFMVRSLVSPTAERVVNAPPGRPLSTARRGQPAAAPARAPEPVPRAALPPAELGAPDQGAADDLRLTEDERAALQEAMDEAERSSLESDEPTGIALFPPPGTEPLKSGIIVPDDFDVPPGYMRYYQSTDNGEQLKPILMFHPDFQQVDESGEPVELPADRVVPPEMAPPGLRIEMLQVPDQGVPMVDVPAGSREP